MVAYITIGIFLLVAGLLLWFFPDTSVLEYGYAELSGFFSLVPYLFMFLIPAVSMRLFAEERKEGTYELLVTKPITVWQIIMAKYMATLVLVLFALIPTLVYCYSIYKLGYPEGNMDSGAAIGSYLGLFLLGAAFTSIGIFASSLTKNQIIAFAIAVFLCFFTFSGFDSISKVIALQKFETSVVGLGINEHYQSISRGVLDTRDLAYFISFVILFLLLNKLILDRSRINKKKRGLYLIGVLGGVIIVNISAQYVYHRFDFTKDKRFTLTDKTKSLLYSTNKPILITVFLDGELPAAFKRLRTGVKDLLLDYKAYSKSEIKIVFVDPLANLNPAEQDTVINNLYQNGIEATNLSVKTENGLTQKLVFPMAMVESDGKQMPVKLFQNFELGGNYEDNINRSIENLEYAFTSSIKKVIAGENPRIGFTESNGELSDLQLYDAIHTLSNSYEVGRVNLNSITKEGLDKLKLLIIAKPTKAFTESEKYKINYFVMNGGRVVWSIDQVSADLDSLKGRDGQMVFNNKLNLDDMLFMYGARINYNVIADRNCAEIPIATGGLTGQMQVVPWMYYPILQPDTASSLVRNIDGIKAEFASTVDTIGTKGVKKIYILKTSDFNRVFNVPKFFSLQMVAEQPDPRTFQNTPQHAGVLLEGNFVSVFAGRPLPAEIEHPYTQSSTSKPAKMIVVGDGDIFKNQVVDKDHSPLPLGFDRFSQRTYGNKAFLLNVADYLTDDHNLIELRNKQVKIRLLDRVKVRVDKVKWQFINVAVPLLLLILCAIFQHYRRKYQYAR